MERVDKKWFIDDLDVSQAFPAPIPSNLTAKDLEKRLEILGQERAVLLQIKEKIQHLRGLILL